VATVRVAVYIHVYYPHGYTRSGQLPTWTTVHAREIEGLFRMHMTYGHASLGMPGRFRDGRKEALV